MTGLVVVGGGFAVMAERQAGHGVGEDGAGTVPGPLQRGREVETVGVSVDRAVDRAGRAPGDGVLMLHADGLAVGVAGSGALCPCLGPGDECAGLDQDFAGCGGGTLSWCLRAAGRVRTRHVENVIEHGDDKPARVVLVEADVAFVVAEFVRGAVE